MFSDKLYRQRRRNLVAQIDSGVILLLGNRDAPMNAADNCYRFRQDSSFLYFCGLEQAGLALLLDVDSGAETLFGDTPGLDDMIWTGPSTPLDERAARAGIGNSADLTVLEERLKTAAVQGRKIHWLPTCRADNRIRLTQLTGLCLNQLETEESSTLVRAVVELRAIKDDGEIAELDAAAELGCRLHTTAMKMARPGCYEWEISGALEAVAAQSGRMLSFPPIVTVHGEILHNHQGESRLKRGDLLLVDAGVESALHYASDHTRTMPVGGRFSTRQRDIYTLVLQGLEKAKALIRPGVAYLDIHRDVCRTLVEGLKSLGLMRGDTEQAVAAGAHALFMPHGLGHMLGLDVHDMEELGEDLVGYDEQIKRSDQFGTARLRLGRMLQDGFALTVEPGIYFIPGLIAQWHSNRYLEEFINYSEVESYSDFGGVRLEDDVLVTATGNRLIGPPIPLQIDEIEELCRE